MNCSKIKIPDFSDCGEYENEIVSIKFFRIKKNRFPRKYKKELKKKLACNYYESRVVNVIFDKQMRYHYYKK